MLLFVADALLCFSLMVACMLEAEASPKEGTNTLVAMTMLWLAALGYLVYAALFTHV